MNSNEVSDTLKGYRLPSEQPRDWGDVVVLGLTDLPQSPADEHLEDLRLAEPAGGTGFAAALLGGGWCRWLNLSQNELSLFRAIPEYGASGFVPSNGPSYNVDGFWYRHVPTHWFKIPDGSLVWIYRDNTARLQLLVRTYIPGYYPEWRSAAGDPPKFGYPW